MEKQAVVNVVAEFLKSEQGEALMAESLSSYIARNDPARLVASARLAAKSAEHVAGYLKHLTISQELENLQSAKGPLEVTEAQRCWLDKLTLVDRIRAAFYVATMGAKGVGVKTHFQLMAPECPTRDPVAIASEAAKLLSDVHFALLKAQPPQMIEQIEKARAERLSRSGHSG